MTGARHLTVSDDDDGQRLDRWLKKQGLPFPFVQKAIRTGQVRVDGKRVKGDVRLVAGQDIRIPPTDSSGAPKKRELSAEDADFIQSLVIYDEGDILAINKPAGLATQGGPGITRHVDGLLVALPNKDGVVPRLVHRLDKDTSGVLLLARTREMAQILGDALKHREVRKYYWAIVAPAPEHNNGEIRAALRVQDGPQKEKVVVDEDTGKKSITFYEVIERAGNAAAFVCFWPRTGRMHQIRVHAALMEAPVLGDDKYGSWPEAVEDMDVAKRLHLHAQRIVLKVPGSKAALDIEAPLPEDLQKTWKSFGFSASYTDDPFADIAL